MKRYEMNKNRLLYELNDIVKYKLGLTLIDLAERYEELFGFMMKLEREIRNERAPLQHR